MEPVCGVLLTFRLTQVLTGLYYFRRFVFRIRQDDKPDCHPGVNRPENKLEYTAEVYPAWMKHRCVPIDPYRFDRLWQPLMPGPGLDRGMGRGAWQAPSAEQPC